MPDSDTVDEHEGAKVDGKGSHRDPVRSTHPKAPTSRRRRKKAGDEAEVRAKQRTGRRRRPPAVGVGRGF